MAYYEERTESEKVLYEYRGGTEHGLKVLAKVVLTVGIVLSIIAFIACFETNARGTYDVKWDLFFKVILFLFFCTVFYYLFSAIAEIIRLLKKLNKLPYSGEIQLGDKCEVRREAIE